MKQNKDTQKTGNAQELRIGRGRGIKKNLYTSKRERMRERKRTSRVVFFK
jgi:hypothetical protein